MHLDRSPLGHLQPRPGVQVVLAPGVRADDRRRDLGVVLEAKGHTSIVAAARTAHPAFAARLTVRRSRLVRAGHAAPDSRRWVVRCPRGHLRLGRATRAQPRPAVPGRRRPRSGRRGRDRTTDRADPVPDRALAVRRAGRAPSGRHPRGRHRGVRSHWRSSAAARSAARCTPPRPITTSCSTRPPDSVSERSGCATSRWRTASRRSCGRRPRRSRPRPGARPTSSSTTSATGCATTTRRHPRRSTAGSAAT